jgi:hypothetical protein
MKDLLYVAFALILLINSPNPFLAMVLAFVLFFAITFRIRIAVAAAISRISKKRSRRSDLL